MKRDIKISVVMAVYNRVNVVEQAISSVVNQTYNNIEFIIIDGGSTDGTIDIIKKYEDKITYWVSEPDTGLYNAFNKGCRAATGDYIAIIGSDDCYCNEHVIEDAVSEIDADTDILSGTKYKVFPDSCYEYLRGNEFARDKSKYTGEMVPNEGLFVRRELRLCFPFDESYRMAADRKFFMTCYYDDSVNIKYIDLPIVYFELSGITTKEHSGANEEDNRLSLELGHPEFVNMFDKRRRDEFWVKYALKTVLKRFGLFNYISAFYNIYVKGSWKKHHCNNKICRWCGRS